MSSSTARWGRSAAPSSSCISRAATRAARSRRTCRRSRARRAVARAAHAPRTRLAAALRPAARRRPGQRQRRRRPCGAGASPCWRSPRRWCWSSARRCTSCGVETPAPSRSAPATPCAGRRPPAAPADGNAPTGLPSKALHRGGAGADRTALPERGRTGLRDRSGHRGGSAEEPDGHERRDRGEPEGARSEPAEHVDAVVRNVETENPVPAGHDRADELRCGRGTPPGAAEIVEGKS